MTEEYAIGGQSYVQVKYLAKYETLVARWLQNVPNEEIGKGCCDLITKITHRNHPIFFLNDNTDQVGAWPDMGDWLLNHWIKSLAEGGIKFYAHILSPSLEGQLSVKAVFKDKMYGISFKTFYGNNPAINWLSEKGLHALQENIQSDIFKESTTPKAIVQDLRDSYDNLDIATETGNMGIWTDKIETGELVVNDQWLKLFGLTRKQHRHNNNLWRNKIHPDDLVKVQQAEGLVRLEADSKRVEVEYRVNSPGQELRFVRCFMTPRRNNDGTIYKVTGINFDITDQLARERELKEALESKNELIQQLNRHTSKIEEQNLKLRQFAFANAHDVRAPLAKIMGLAEMLKMEDSLDKDEYDYLVSSLVDSSNELDNVIRRLAKILAIDADATNTISIKTSRTNVQKANAHKA